MASTDGFVRLPNWLVDDSDLSLHELAVYIVLLRFRDPKTGKCFPGMTTIADRARISRRAVMRAIEDLERREMIRVERRSSLKENKPNVYHVALANETPEFIWATSARGRRVPRRRATSDSESLGQGVEQATSDSESLPSDSQTPAPVTQSHPKQIHVKKIHEQALRQTKDRPPDDLFSFDAVETATLKQLTYLQDLHIFLTERLPDQRTRDKWIALDTTAASDLISAYWQQLPRGRGGNWESEVDEIHPLYRHLSTAGKQWVAKGCLPDIGALAA